MQKIRRDDEVIVIAGKDKGKRGKVAEGASPMTVWSLAGLTWSRSHHQAQPHAGRSGWHRRERSPSACSPTLPFSTPETNKADRVGFKVEDGKKHSYLQVDRQKAGPGLKLLGRSPWLDSERDLS